MKRLRPLILGSITIALLALGPAAAHDRDEPTGSQAQDKLDRDLDKIEQRAQERAQRAAEDRARIEARASQDPDKAARDLAKLEADLTEAQQKDQEERAKVEADFADDAAKEAEDAAERGDRLDDSGSGNRGSSQDIADLGSSEGADHDADGFAVKAGELVAIDLSPDRLAAAQSAGFRVVRQERLPTLGRDVVHLEIPQGTELEAARDQLRTIAPEATVDLVHYYGLNLAAGGQGQPVRGGHAPKGQVGEITVGLIDTAVSNHPALAKSRLTVWSEGALAGAPVDHGTAVASLLAAQGRGTIYSANIFRGPATRPFTSADVIVQALEWMVSRGVPTINMSLAGPRNALLDRLIRDSIARGFTVVAAAGNGGPTAPPSYPAAVPGVIAVTAVDKDNRVYRYAQHGPYITVAAPGVDIIAANARGGFARFSGTSFATPGVAGWIARCRSGGSGAAECRIRLRRSARDLGPVGFDETYGFGVIR